jgi:hypothetical protein
VNRRRAGKICSYLLSYFNGGQLRKNARRFTAGILPSYQSTDLIAALHWIKCDIAVEADDLLIQLGYEKDDAWVSWRGIESFQTNRRSMIHNQRRVQSAFQGGL